LFGGYGLRGHLFRLWENIGDEFWIMPKPPVGRSETTPWPFWPLQLKHPHHEEGCDRNWLINTKEFISKKRELVGLKTVEVDWKMTGTRPELVEKGSEKTWPVIWHYCRFTGPEKPKQSIRLELDMRTNYKQPIIN
jgi:glutamate synthase (NADPH/NADH) small chain